MFLNSVLDKCPSFYIIDLLLTTLPGRMNAVLRGSAQWKKGETPEVGGREIRVLVTPMPDADASD